jgi:hypothetical protein
MVVALEGRVNSGEEFVMSWDAVRLVVPGL